MENMNVPYSLTVIMVTDPLETFFMFFDEGTTLHSVLTLSRYLHILLMGQGAYLSIRWGHCHDFEVSILFAYLVEKICILRQVMTLNLCSL